MPIVQYPWPSTIQKNSSASINSKLCKSLQDISAEVQKTWDVQNTPEEVLVEEESQEDSKPESPHSNGSTPDSQADGQESATEGTSSRCSALVKVLWYFVRLWAR